MNELISCMNNWFIFFEESQEKAQEEFAYSAEIKKNLNEIFLENYEKSVERNL